MFSRLLVAIAVAAVISIAIHGSRGWAVPRCGPYQAQGTTHTSGSGGVARPLSIDQLTDQSAAVVIGRVERFRACADRPGQGTTTEVTVTVEQALKSTGPPLGARVTFNVPGGRLDGYTMAVGTSSEFVAGEHVIVFLRQTPSGKWRQTGEFQGRITINEAGRADSLGVSVSELSDVIEKAAAGSLAGTEDPLASSAGTGGPMFVLFGYWPALPVPYFTNTTAGKPAQISSAQALQAWNDAFSTWQTTSGSNIAFQYQGSTSRVSAADDCPGPDGFNDITWGLFDPEHDPSILAITLSCLDNMAHILDSEIEFDTDHFGTLWRVDGSGSCDSGLFDLQTVALHESGHFIGLAHPSANGCTGPMGDCPVMNAHYTGVRRQLCPDDANGARALYGVPVGGLAAAPFLAGAPTVSRHTATLGGTIALVIGTLVLAAVRFRRA